VADAEASANVDISGFSYSISGSHLRSMKANSLHQIDPSRHVVTQRDVDAVLEKASSIAVPFDHAILANNPVEFRVDGIGGIENPLDRQGRTLEVDAYLVTGSSSVQNNVERAIAKAGCKGVAWQIDVLAAAESLLTEAETREGVLLIDVGGALTQWAVYRFGRIAGSGQIPWGGNHMTYDLSHGLRIGLREAEAVKRKRGVVLRSLTGSTDTSVLFEEDNPTESPALVAAILEPRLEEIVSLIREDMGDAFRAGQLGAGVIVTGGGARCRGTGELVEEVLGVHAEVRLEPLGLANARALPDCQWATAAGLAFALLDDRHEPPRTDAGGGVLDWIGGLFGGKRKKS
jgi:cell division protein FtsA